MKALTIQQPTPWAITHLGMDLINRRFSTTFRGRFLLHAGAEFDQAFYQRLLEMKRHHPEWPDIPSMSKFSRAGVVGTAVLRDCVQASDSPWFTGPFAFTLIGIQTLPWFHQRGGMGFFEVDPPYPIKREGVLT